MARTNKTDRTKTTETEPKVVTPEVKPTVKDEPKVVTPEVKDEPKQPEVDTMLNAKDIVGLISDNKKTIDEKLELIGKNGIPLFKSIINKTLDYNNKMKPSNTAMSVSTIASNNFDFYSTLNSVVSDTDYDVFKTKMDILSLMFIRFAKEGLDEFRLQRGDHKWTWGEKSLVTYQRLVTMFTMLSDRSTRDKNLKQISFEKLFENSSLTIVAKENITKYYS